MKIKKIDEVLPILGFKGNVLVSNNLDLTFGLKLQMPEVFSLSEEKISTLHNTFRRVVSLLPTGSLLHKQDLFLLDKFQSNLFSKENPSESLTDSYLQHFDERAYLRHECYLYISILNRGQLKDYLSSSLIYSKRERKGLELQCDKIRELEANLIALFSQSGIDCSLLMCNEAVGDDLCVGLIERVLTLNFQGGEPILGAIDFRDRLNVMGRFVEILSLSDYSHVPTEIKPTTRHPQTGLPVSLVYPLTWNLPFSHVTNQFIYVPDQQAMKASLEGNYKKIYSLSRFSTENRVNSTLIDQFLNTVQTTGEKIVKTHFNVMLFEESISQLKQNKSQTCSAFSMMNCLPYQHNFDLPLLFFASLPYSTQIPETELFITQVPQACCLTNFEGSIHSSNSEFTILLSDRLSGCPVRIDLSDEPIRKHLIHNRNKIIIGGSGSGKSFFTNHLLRQYAESENCHIVLLDVGRSYQLLTQYLDERLKHLGGAMMVEYTSEHPISFNP
jgi:conjugation system TraG family ATPase